MTDTERFVWQRLRYRQLAAYKFRRQFEIGPFIVDFICLECRSILELDGGQHALQEQADASRTRWLESQGFKVLRFWNNEVLENWDGVEEEILKHLKAHTPHPNPPPQGGREQAE